jgi:hypothetical protein
MTGELTAEAVIKGMPRDKQPRARTIARLATKEASLRAAREIEILLGASLDNLPAALQAWCEATREAAENENAV